MNLLATRSEIRRPSSPPVPSADWFHLCNGLDPVRDGGMVPSILGMTGALIERREAVAIVTGTESRLGDSRVHPALPLAGPEVPIEEAVRHAQVVHLHGLWQAHTRRGAAEARRRHTPYVIAAHGMAEPWALRQKALKKKVYTALVEGKNLRRADCLHALSRPEIGHLRALAPRATVAFIPNGVDLRPLADLPPRSRLEARHPELAGKFVLLFLSRVHAKKGLDLLAEALGGLAPAFPELHVVLAGKDDGALAPFLDQARSLGVADRVTYLGHVSGESAREAWGAADAFVLPSYSEGFSMAILEALACRLPALITTACHFPELAAADGGIVVEPDAPSVTRGLRQLLDLGVAGRAALGARGRALVETDYTWDRQAARLAELYRWLLAGGAPPDFVDRPR